MPAKDTERGRIGLLMRSLAVLLGAALFAARGQSGSSGDLKKMSLEELSAVEVTTPSKEPVKAFRTPAAVYVITGDDIRRAGAKSLPEALRLVPGVEVARINSSRYSIGIRGFGTRLSRSVLVLIDGREVYTPLFAGTYWEAQDTLLEDIDRIEVIRGPGGTIWGPNAVDGVINIITKPAKLTRGDYVSAGGGNQQQGAFAYRHGGGNGDTLNYRTYAKAFTRGPEDHADGRNYDDWRGTQAGFRADWNAGPHDSLTVQGDIYTEKVGELVNPTSYAPPYSTIVSGNAALSGGNILARWQKKLAGGGDIQVQAYIDHTSHEEVNLADYRTKYDIDFVSHLPLGSRHALTWGLSARVDPIHDKVVVTGLQFLPEHRTDSLVTGFVQDQISLVDNRLSVVLGTKLLRTNFTGLQTEPSARLLWTPSDKQTVWTAYTHAVRTPSDVEENFFLVGLTGQTVNGTVLLARFDPDTKFAPEQLNGVELGYRRLIAGSVLLDVSSFYNHYHDLEDLEFTGSIFPEDNPPPFHYLLPAGFRNGLRGYTKGIEIAPEWRPAPWWRIRGSYSYLHMNLGKSPGSTDVGTIPGILGASPHHKGDITSSFDIGKSLQLDLTFRRVDALLGVPAYSTADSRIAWRLTRNVELAFAARNLLQPHHIEFSDDPGSLVGIRRSGYLELSWRR